jgi:hypothetical protein
MFERARLFLFSAYAGQSPAPGTRLLLFLESVFANWPVISPLFSILTKKTGVATPVASRTLPIRSISSGPLHYRPLRRKIVSGPSSALETSPLFSVSNQMSGQGPADSFRYTGFRVCTYKP